MDPTSEPKTLTRASLNVEKMPIVFLCDSEERKKIESQIFQNRKPLLIYDSLEDGEGKRLSIMPSVEYGLLSGFDMDVLTVIHYKLFELTRNLGRCPENLRIGLSEFPKIMKLKTAGDLYDRIRDSVKRISETEIYQENFVKVKETQKGSLKSYHETSLKILYYRGLYKETLAQGKMERMRKIYIDLDIPEWHRNNINNGYTTEFDPDVYFALKNDRSKRIYRLLELIRYEKTRFVPYSKIVVELSLSALENKVRKRTIIRALEPLINIGFLESYAFIESYLKFTFARIKKASAPVKYTNGVDPLNDFEKSMVDHLVRELHDDNSRNYFSMIVPKVPEDILYKCLSLTKESIVFDGIKKSKGAIFIDHLKRECQKLNIVL